MAKIAIVNVGAHGHVNPTLAVVAELVKHGAEVIYFAPAAWREAVEAVGAKHEAYDSVFPSTPPAQASAAELAAQLPARLTEECLHTLPQLEPRLIAARPDVIIYDKFCLAPRLLAQKLGIKAATWLSSYAGNQHFSIDRFAAVKPLEGHPATLRFQADAQRLEGMFDVNLRVPGGIFSHSEPLNICFVAQPFQYEVDTFDERYVFVGPCLMSRSTAGTWQRPEPSQRPLVFVSLGTVFNAWPEFFAMCFEAFAGMPWDALIAVGHQCDQTTFAAPPPNVTLAAHVPQLDVLPATSIFVTHGGMNSTMESLWHGVPMVVIPQMFEQAATAQRVAALGLGRAFSREEISVSSLRAAVAALLVDEATKARVLAMQQQVRASGGQVKAAAAIMSYAAAAPARTASKYGQTSPNQRA